MMRDAYPIFQLRVDVHKKKNGISPVVPAQAEIQESPVVPAQAGTQESPIDPAQAGIQERPVVPAKAGTQF
jgi:hypothetical protein